MAAEKWRIRDAASEVILYKEGGEDLTYQSVVLTSVETWIQRMLDGLKLLQEEENKAKKNVEVAQKSADELPGLEWNKNEKVLKKLKVTLQFELENLEYSKSRIVTLYADPNDLDLWATWSTKVESLEKSMQSLKKQIQELEGITREVNQDTFDTLEKLRVIKEKIVDANAKIAKRR